MIREMFEALETMDEGVYPVEYLYQKFQGRLKSRLLFLVIDLVVEKFYANYW